MKSTQDIKEFVRNEFKKKECKRFVMKKNLICYCGATKEEHFDTFNEGSALWSAQSDISVSPTDAFGEIHFKNENKGKYVRVNEDANVIKLFKFMMDYWDLQIPKLLISVTGGAKNFVLNNNLKEVFRDGLIKAASTTSAWILTGGTSEGVMKHVGEAVRDYTLLFGTKNPIVTIGIATWGCINNNNLLVNEEGCWPAEYEIKEPLEHRDTGLDMNHSHFILVDDGTRHKYGVEIELRALLERQIVTTAEGCLNIPRILVVLEGGPNTLETVMSSMFSGTPVIVAQGSGRVADLLAFAYNYTEMNGNDHTKVISSCDDNFQKMLDAEIIKTFPHLNILKVQDMRSKILLMIDNREFLTILKLDEMFSSQIEIVILNALIKTKQISPIDQLRLALDWNLADTASTDIYTDFNNFKVADIQNLMYKALLENKVEFVRLILSRDFDIKSFLYSSYSQNKENQNDVKNLLNLYIQKSSKICWSLTSKQNIDLNEVSNIINDLTGNYYEHRYCGDNNEALLYPATDLFFWSVFVRYRKMAMVFLEYSKYPTAAVLTAQHITKSMLKSYPESEFSEVLKTDIEFYGKVAVDLLDELYKCDQTKTEHLLNENLAAFGESTILTIALKADNKEFVAHPAVQNIMTNIWMDRLSENNSYLRFFISLVIPFLAPYILSIKKEQVPAQTNKDENGWDKYKNDLLGFFNTPLTKFFYYWASYFAFILLFGVILLTDFYPIKLNTFQIISKKEIILTLWIFSLFLEEIRQALTDDGKTILSKIANYSKDEWNKLDMLILVLYITGFTLRFVPTYFNKDCFFVARIILSFCLLALFMRILHLFAIHRELGPKVVMIGEMMIDLFYFMLILMVFIAAYGFSTHIIMYPNQKLNLSLFIDVLSSAWWDIYGAHNLNEVSGEECVRDITKYDASFCAATFNHEDDWSQCLGKDEKCPAINWLVPIMLATYALIVNIMMLNILIAIFSNTFNNIQNQTNLVWRKQRCSLVREFKKKPAIPPPFNLIDVYWHFDQFKKQILPENNTGSIPDPSEKKETKRKLRDWERIYSKEYIRKKIFNNPIDNAITKINITSMIKDYKSILKNQDLIQNKILKSLEFIHGDLCEKITENFISHKDQIIIDKK